MPISFAAPRIATFTVVAVSAVLCSAVPLNATAPTEVVSVLSDYAPQEEAIVYVTPQGHTMRVREALREALERVSADLEIDERHNAEVASREAVDLIRRIPFPRDPWVGLTDEGIAILQWRAEERGVMLLFSGDGTVTISKATATQNYSDNSANYNAGGNVAVTIASIISNLYS